MTQISFAEERQGQLTNETRYDQPVIVVGRNAAACHIVFNQKDWPMVSRQHAEFRLEGGRWIVSDKGSTHGTFLNGQPLKTAAEVREHSRIQFGSSGPTLIVTGIGAQADQEATLVAPRSVSSGSLSSSLPPETFKPAQQTPLAFVELSGAGTGSLKRIELSKEVTRFGRDAAVEGAIDAAAAVVSRRHAEIRRQDGKYILFDLGSFNGTTLNGRRIAAPEVLHHQDKIELGHGGPTIHFLDPAHPAPRPMAQPAPSGLASAQLAAEAAALKKMGTMVLGSASPLQISHAGTSDRPHIFLERGFGPKGQLTIGRGQECDIRLDGLLISNRHALVVNTTAGVTIEDLNSSNGTYLNGQRITGRNATKPEHVIQIGPFLLRLDSQKGVAVFDTRAKTRIDVFQVTKDVPNRSGAGKVRLLDEVSLSIQPNEFVGLLGPSGAGKSTLMDSLNGMRPASSGQVLVNNLDLYQHLESLKQSIGYVPQDDIIHRELTVYNTLYYVARLRLSRDISTKEINQIVAEVMDVTGLSERRDVPISQLSGGQRKRVSIAVELITKPSVIFLDEPTSGLDPATEEKVMKLFRQIAESGRTVILTTHAMENVKLFDKVVLLMRGKLVFYGKPDEALAHVGAGSFKELYDKLEAPISERLATNGISQQQAAEEVADHWKQRFQKTAQFRQNVAEPLTEVSSTPGQMAPAKRRTKLGDSVRQWATLSRRYLGVLARDKVNLLILFAQAPLIALLTYLVVGATAPRDFPYFILALVALWFGTSVASREVIRERAVYNRERMVNLRLLPYVGSKLFVLMLIVSVQCVLLFGTLKLLDLTTLMSLPGKFAGLPQMLVMILTGMVGVALGLFISAVVKTSEMATSLVPLILIPQILFSGLVGVPTGFAKVVGVVMPATWSFDEMKRLSGLEVLRGKDEDAEPAGTNEGRGLYKEIEHQNEANISDAKQRINQYKSDAESKSKNFEKEMEAYQKELLNRGSPAKPTAPVLGAAPEIAEAVKVPDNLSNYVDFLHPWGGALINVGVLVTMLLLFLGATGIALRAQDIG